MSYIGKEQVKIMDFIDCPSCSAALVLEDCMKCEFHQEILKEPIIQIVNKVETVIGEDVRILCKLPRLIKVKSLNKVPEDKESE